MAEWYFALVHTIYNMRNPNTKCSICGKPIYKRPSEITANKSGVFCSQECYGISCRKEIPCVICEKPILASLNKKTCSKECLNQFNQDTNRKHSLGKRKIIKHAGYSSRSFRKYFLEKKGGKCSLCDYSIKEILNIHHIIERKNGGSDEEENLILLCPNCHAEIHKGFKTLETYSIGKEGSLLNS